MEPSTVVIAGAGPTGLLAANLLGQQGVPVVLIEEDAGLTTSPKAVLIDDTSLRALQTVGLYEAMRDKIILGYGSRYINNQDHCFMEIGYECSEQAYPKRNAFSQPDLEAVLLQGLKRFACVDIRMQTKLVAVEQSDECVSVGCETSEGQKYTITGGVLLACDGGRSTVRKLLNIKMQGDSAQQDWLVVDVINDEDVDRYTKFKCSHEHASVSIPQPNKARRYEYLLLDGEDHEQAASYESVKQRLAATRDLQPDDLVRSTVYTFHALVAEHMVKGRVMLLGDAAHLTPPFAGQGLNAGLRDALSAYWRAAWVARGEADAGFLQTYHQERHQQCRDMIVFALNLGKIMMPKDAFDQQVTERLFELAGLIPEARDYIYNMRFKPAMHLQQGFMINTLGLFPDSDPAGKKLPQPIVTLSSGHEVLLDALLGGEFALIGLGIDSVKLLTAAKQQLPDQLTTRSVVLLLPHDIFPDELDDGVVYARVHQTYLMNKAYRFLPSIGQVILVRPDRYCLAVIMPGQLDRLKGYLGRVLGQDQLAHAAP